MEELKSCPFCGDEALLSKLSNPYYDMFGVGCSGAKDSGCRLLTIQWDETKEEAVESWNKRA